MTMPRKDYWIELSFTHGDEGMSYKVFGENPFPHWRPGPNSIRVLHVRGAISTTDAVARVLASVPVFEEVWSLRTGRRVTV